MKSCTRYATHESDVSYVKWHISHLKWKTRHVISDVNNFARKGLTPYIKWNVSQGNSYLNHTFYSKDDNNFTATGENLLTRIIAQLSLTVNDVRQLLEQLDSLRSIIRFCFWNWQIIGLFAKDKTQYFVEPRLIIKVCVRPCRIYRIFKQSLPARNLHTSGIQHGYWHW